MTNCLESDLTKEVISLVNIALKESTNINRRLAKQIYGYNLSIDSIAYRWSIKDESATLILSIMDKLVAIRIHRQQVGWQIEFSLLEYSYIPSETTFLDKIEFNDRLMSKFDCIELMYLASSKKEQCVVVDKGKDVPRYIQVNANKILDEINEHLICHFSSKYSKFESKITEVLITNQ